MADDHSVDESRVTWRAVVSQLLFRAGHSLTSGGFFYYFVNEFHPSARMLALLQVAPETAESLGVFARWVIRKTTSRKWTWVGGVVLARLVALMVPLTLLLRGSVSDATLLWVILLSTLLWYGCQGVTYVTYLSWLSDLVPDRHWGRFFAKWTIASLVVAIIVPTAAGQLRYEYLRVLSPQWQAWSYGIIFTAGSLVVVVSVVPMLRLPDRGAFASPLPVREDNDNATASVAESLPSSTLRLTMRTLLQDQRYRRFLIHYWWLSFFQGLTQAVIFIYQSRILEVPPEIYYRMYGLMLLLQIPLSWLGGWLSDRHRDREVLVFGLLAVSGAMGFWMAATPDRPGLVWGAFAMWGLFGAVNVCENNLNLKLAPQSDNSLHLSLVRQWGGAFAALSGLLGAWWLDAWAGAEFSPSMTLAPFQTIFLVSWLGRATAGLWLLGVRINR